MVIVVAAGNDGYELKSAIPYDPSGLDQTVVRFLPEYRFGRILLRENPTRVHTRTSIPTQIRYHEADSLEQRKLACNNQLLEQ